MAGKLEELSYEMNRYHWNILGLCEVQRKNFGETSTEESHKLYFSGKEDKHNQGIGFLVHKDIVNTVMGCPPISSRLITIRLRASPFNITIILVYPPRLEYDDDAGEDFYDHLLEVLDQSPKRDILVVLGNGNAKVGEDAFKNWTGTCGCYCNPETNERGLRLLEFACYNDLVLVNTLGKHLVSRRWTWQSPNGGYHNQLDYIMVRRRFMTSVNTTKTRSFQGADIGSDHDFSDDIFSATFKEML